MILKVNGKSVDFFNSFQLTLKYDAVASAFSFTFFFNPNNAEHKALFRPCQYQRVTVEHNNELLLTGTLLSHSFKQSATKELCALGGYSLPGVLEDCEIPTSLYPLQNDGLNISQIVQKLLSPFGINYIVDSSVSNLMSENFFQTTAGEGQTIKSYLTEICAQKNIIISHNELGQLLFTSAKTHQAPLINYSDGEPFTKIDLAINGQSMHSDLAVILEGDPNSPKQGEFHIKNPYVNIYRPKVKKQTSGTDNSSQWAAQNALCEDLKGIQLKIETDRWIVNGKILKPNNIISVISPENFIYKRTLFFIESISFTGDNTKTVASLTCVLPEVYNRQTPINIFA